MSITAYATTVNFKIPAKNVDKAFHAAHSALLKEHPTYDGVLSLSDIMDYVFLDNKVDDNGDVIIIGFDATSNYEIVVLKSIAPLALPGSWIDFEEEDGAIRHDVIIDGKYVLGDPEYPEQSNN